MKHSFNYRLFYALLLGLFVTTFISCSDDDEPSIDLRTLCQQIPSDKIKMTLNGETIEEPGDVAFAFPNQQSPEEEIFESKMLIEMTSLWPNNDKSNLAKNFYFEVDAQSSPNKIVFTGSIQKQEQYKYELDLEGYYENNELVLNMNYRSKDTNLIGNTYELEINVDAFNLGDIMIKTETVEWNGEQVPITEFLHESLKPIFGHYVEKTGNDAVRVTFSEDGSMGISFRDSRTHTFSPVSGHYAYRLNGSAGWLEAGQEEAVNFCKDFLPYSFPLPNGLFWATQRNKAFIPIYYRTGSDKLLMTLHINGDNDNDLILYFLNEWTCNVSDDSEPTMRLHKVRSLFHNKSISGLIWGVCKKVS